MARKPSTATSTTFGFQADLVDCMIVLPGQLFYSTQIPVCLWFLAKNKAADAKRGFRDRCVEVRCVAVHGDASLWEGTQGENRAAKGGGMRPANHNDLGSQSTASPIGNRRNRRQGRLRHRSSAGRPFAVPLPGPACPPAPPDRPRVFLAFLSARSRDTPANQPTTIQERRVFNRRRCIDPSRK